MPRPKAEKTTYGFGLPLSILAHKIINGYINPTYYAWQAGIRNSYFLWLRRFLPGSVKPFRVHHWKSWFNTEIEGIAQSSHKGTATWATKITASFPGTSAADGWFNRPLISLSHLLCPGQMLDRSFVKHARGATGSGVQNSGLTQFISHRLCR